MIEDLSSSETSVNIYQTTRRSIPEDSHRVEREFSKVQKRQFICRPSYLGT
jgi:hypothetical protein